MLDYMPIAGSIFLTAIIAFVAINAWRRRRPVVTWKAGGLPAKSICCDAPTRPIGWSADGWVALCSACGTWQYLGDDHDNPPPGFNLDGSPSRSFTMAFPAPDDYAFVRDYDPDAPAYSGVVMPEQVLRRPLGEHESNEALAPEVTSDEGDMLAVPPQPNIGGEGNPDYQGPHYDVPHDRYVPYDMLRNPIPGTGVFSLEDDDDGPDDSTN